MKKTYKLLALLATLSVGPAIAQTLNPPSIIAPKSGAINVSENTTFLWHKVPSAFSYHLKIYQSDSLIIETAMVDTLSLHKLAANGSYSWEIRTLSFSDTSAFSPKSYFTTKATAPDMPYVISPVGAISVVNGGANNSTVGFNWSATEFATNYHFQVSYDTLFNSLIINDSSYSDNYYKNSFTLFDYNKTYYWRVAAKSNAGTSNFTKATAFSIPVESTVPADIEFVSPTKGQNDVPIYTAIFWRVGKLATGYSFTLRDTLGNVVLQDDRLDKTDTMMIVNALKYGTFYTATVYARNEYGLSEPSDLYFTTENEITMPTTPTYGSKGSMGDVVYYNYNIDGQTKRVFAQWSYTKSFQTVLSSDSIYLTGTSYRANNLALNKWFYVKIVAHNDLGSSTALIDSVYNIMPSPNTVYIVSPRDSSAKLTPTIKWTTSKWATSYRVSISTFGKADTIYNALRADTSFVLAAGYLEAGKVYDLYVEAINSMGSTATYKRIYTTNIPTPPAPVTKKDTVYMQDGSFPTLTWPAVSGATSYCVQIAKDSNFVQLTANDCNVIGTSYSITPNGLILARTEATTDSFFWRVAATNASGQGVWSTPSTFSVVIITANEESNINQTVSVFPNPVVNTLTINAEVVSVNVKNTSGVVILEGPSNTLDMSNLTVGMYFVEFRTKAGATHIVKVIKGE